MSSHEWATGHLEVSVECIRKSQDRILPGREKCTATLEMQPKALATLLKFASLDAKPLDNGSLSWHRLKIPLLKPLGISIPQWNARKETLPRRYTAHKY